MFAKSCPPEELIDILAAPSYAPELMAYCKKVENEPLLIEYLERKPKLGITGSIAKDYVSSDMLGAVPYISTKQVKGLYAYIDDAKYISKIADIEWKKCRVTNGDIVINKSGNVGAAAILNCMPFKYVNSVSDIISISLRNDSTIDKEYLVTYLNSPYGQKQLQRLGGGAIFDHVSLHAIPDVNVYIADVLCQKYIGGKVRRAERLRAWADKLEISVNHFHCALISSQDNLDFEKRIRRVPIKRMAERLDAHFYPGVVEEYLNTNPGKFKSLRSITTRIYNGQTQPEIKNNQSCKQITVTNLSPMFLTGQSREVQTPSNKEKFLKPHDILMCNAAHNKSYIGRDLTYVHSESEILPSTEVMTIRIDRKQIPASYVRTYLLSKLGFVQIQSTIRGITAHSYPDDMALLDIFIPDIAPEKREAWFECDNTLIVAGKACEMATQLTEVAKYLLEALIEGGITESQLIEAQKSLESGDNDLDREILSRMSSDGFDGEEKPLFTDLDSLYDLLLQAEKEMDE